MYQISFGDEDRVEQLLYLRVPSFGLDKHLNDEVDGPLYFEYVAFICTLYNKCHANNLSGSSNVKEESLA
jgi:uncharacterized membrane protein